jgi:hypothetical protein
MSSKNKKLLPQFGYIWLYLPQFGATPAQVGAGIWIGRLWRFFGVFLWGGQR